MGVCVYDLLSVCVCRLQVFLNTYGIQTQTPQQVEPIQIWPQKELVKVKKIKKKIILITKLNKKKHGLFV